MEIWSKFRFAIERTHRFGEWHRKGADKKKSSLIARLIKEEERLSENEDNMTSLALQVNRINLNSAAKREKGRKNIQDLKKRTKCAFCKEKGHWVRECPKKKENESDCNKSNSNGRKTASAYVCDVTALYSNTSDEDNDVWIADSGASMHMTYRSDYFTSFEAVPEEHFVKVADDKILAAAGKGTIVIQEKMNGQLQERELKNVLLVPGLKRNLFSIATISSNNFSFHAYKKKCEVRDSEGELSSIGVRYKTLFRMLFQVKVPLECNVAQLTMDKLRLWHERLGHINMRAVKHTCEKLGIGEIANNKVSFFCDACMTGKQTRKSHTSTENRSNFGPGEKIHSDVCGPIKIKSPSGSRYFLLFKDECTRYRKVCFLKYKSEVAGKFKEFEALVATQIGTKIKVLRSDNGTEYTCDKLHNLDSNSC